MAAHLLHATVLKNAGAKEGEMAFLGYIKDKKSETKFPLVQKISVTLRLK